MGANAIGANMNAKPNPRIWGYNGVVFKSFNLFKFDTHQYNHTFIINANCGITDLTVGWLIQVCDKI
jgi:hypothetical protein